MSARDRLVDDYNSQHVRFDDSNTDPTPSDNHVSPHELQPATHVSTLEPLNPNFMPSSNTDLDTKAQSNSLNTATLDGPYNSLPSNDRTKSTNVQDPISDTASRTHNGLQRLYSPNTDSFYSSHRGSGTSLDTSAARSSYVSAPSDIPQIELETPSTATKSPTPKDTTSTNAKWLSLNDARYPSNSPKSSPNRSSFAGINLEIGSLGLSEEIGTKKMNFSARGSMLVDGKKVNGIIAAKTMPIIKEPNGIALDAAVTSRKRAVTTTAQNSQIRMMSTDEEQLSEKVRSFYIFGTDAPSETDMNSTNERKISQRWQNTMHLDTESAITTSRATSMTDLSVARSPQTPSFPRENLELAGGLEDWQDVNNGDVDRYGFIVPKSPVSDRDEISKTDLKRTPTTSGQGLQRVTTALQLASDTPRRKRTIHRSPSTAHSTRSERSLRRPPSSQSMQRPASSKSVNIHRNHSAARHFTNKLPHNKDRRLLDEASDMLTLPGSGTADSDTLRRVQTDDGSSNTTTYSVSEERARRKEAEREEKWRKMATMTNSKDYNNPNAIGGGQSFSFPTTSTKLIERTWKGIPDTWRSTAWHSFMNTSVQRYNKLHPTKPCLTDEHLIALFHDYQPQSSPDDVQIDIDVPRTISSHIMFRRRYRGGQRLLFRVLHAMSMHFAETGYVQGMAALAATLLAYYSEELAFVMLVRLWELRGLDKLYAHGFGGLMEALDDFEKGWLGQGELRARLDEMMIGPTAYGTRWYLTLFNYSIPFPAQLRVWDVFMLLGDDEDDRGDGRPRTQHKRQNNDNANANTTDPEKTPVPPSTTDGAPGKADSQPFGTTLDILHATSAALIDGMRDILLESDFETSMKVLTSWVPIRDEDLFMRVARAEWKVHREKRRKGQA